MNRPYFIGFHDSKLNKFLFMGDREDCWYSDFQSAKAHSKPEIKRTFQGVKRLNKDKKLQVIKIDVKPL